jgi:outer membrane protein insertion porin family
VSGSLSLFSSRDRFFQFSEGARRRTGASLRFGLPVPSDRSGRTRFFVGYSLAKTTYTQFEHTTNSALFGLPSGIQSTVTLNLVRNTLDSPLFPTVGTKQEITADFNGGLLGGDANFSKYTVSGAWFVPVGSLGAGKPGARPIRFTLGLHAEAGALFGNATNFPFERFWLGGVQFGRPLRGYEETSVTPFGYVPKSDATFPLQNRLGNAYMKLTAEYALRFNDNMSISAFYDAGNIWRNPSEINPTRMLRGAGIGVQLVTPFGPLGLDYGYGFDKTVPGWQLHFRFGPGF